MRKLSFVVLGCAGFLPLLRAAECPYDCAYEARRLAEMRHEADMGILNFAFPGTFAQPPTAVMLPDVPPELEEQEWPLVEKDGIYDVGREGIGYVWAESATEPKLFVGESLPEVMNEDAKTFEQSTKMVKTGEIKTEGQGVRFSWRSKIPLALRYVRFAEKPAKVRFLAQMPKLPVRGAFASSNPRLEEMYKAGVHTVALCSRTFLIDGIKRDRLPWANDLTVSARSSLYAYGDNEIIKRSLRILDSAGPRGGDINGIVGNSLWIIIAHDLYQRFSGDRAFLKECWPRIRERLDSFGNRCENGFVTKDIKWDFIDWTEPRSALALQVIYWAALEAGVRLADRMDAEGAANSWRSRAKWTRERLLATGFDETRHSRILAIVFGLVTGDEARRVAHELAADKLPSVGTPYMSTYEVMALVRGGEWAAARKKLEQVWGGMLDNGATSFWEGYVPGEGKDKLYSFYGRPFAKSLCHAWAAGPAYLMAGEFMGVRPTADGWSEYEVNPMPGLKDVSCTIPTPRGLLKVDIDAEGKVTHGFLSEKPVVKRIFREARPSRGNTNVMRLQPIDAASWLWLPGERSEEPVFLKFRKEFTVATGEAPLTVDVSADERFHLTCDGELVGRGPNRSTVENWQYNTYEIVLAPGRHVLEAAVWRTVGAGPLAQLSCRGGFVLKADGVFDKRLTTGVAAWQVGRLDGIEPMGRDGGAWGGGDQWKITGSGIVASEPARWEEAEVVRSGAGLAGPMIWGSRTPGWMLFPSQIPDQTEDCVRPGRVVAATHKAQWRNVDGNDYAYVHSDKEAPEVKAFNDFLDGKAKTFVVPAHTRLQLAWDLGRYICAYPEVRLGAAKGARLSWCWTEATRRPKIWIKGSEPGARDAIVGRYLEGFGDVFVPAADRAGDFTTPWFRCGKWCRLDVETADDPLVVESLALVESRYPLEMESAFATPEDATLEDIRRISARAMQMCCHEMLFDCPFYEQQMYPGDTRVQLNVLTAMSRDDRMIKRAIELFDLAARDDGQCPFNWPTRGLQEGATYTLCYLLMYGDYVMNHADRDWLKARLPGLRKSMAGMEYYENADGLLENMPGWQFMDWVVGWRSDGTAPGGRYGEGVNAEANLFWILAMQSAALTERTLGHELQAQYWEDKAAKLKAKIVETFWCERRGLLADTPEMKDFSEHAQSLAILGDVLPKDKAETAFRHLVEDADLARCTVYFSYYLFETYFKMGRGDLFQKRLDLWRDYVKKGLTTTQEAPDSGKNGQKESRSDCHAWGAHPIWFMQTGLAGIRSDAPFFAKVRVAPCPGTLTRLTAKHPHPQGFVEVDIAFKDGKASGTVKTPVPGTFVYGGETRELKPGTNML